MGGRAHSHDHQKDLSGVSRANLVVVTFLNLLITGAEVLGGVYSGSLSLISDALHNFGDGIAVVISYLAIKISQKGSDEKRTFGYKRSTILAALANSTFLMAVSLYLFKESYHKFLHPSPVDGGLVITVASVGLVANFLGMLLLQKGSRKDINIRSSYLHLLTDALSSLGVIVAGAVIYWFDFYLVDPLVTVLIAIYVFKESFDIVKKAVNILMQGVPDGVDIYAVVKDIREIDGVVGVHHVHIWSLNENCINFEAHVNIKDMLVSETKELLERIEGMLSSRYGINHVTIQFEHNSCSGEGVIASSVSVCEAAKERE